MRPSPFLRALAAGAVCIAAVLLACEDATPPTPCREIPIGGCPNQGDATCADPSCFNVYDCVGGEWKYNRQCPRGDAGGGADAGSHETSSSVTFDADVDAPPGAFGGPGCVDLEMPDCPLGLALECPTSDCCGCENLFVCQDGAWSAYGSCSPDSGITTP